MVNFPLNPQATDQRREGQASDADIIKKMQSAAETLRGGHLYNALPAYKPDPEAAAAIDAFINQGIVPPQGTTAFAFIRNALQGTQYQDAPTLFVQKVLGKEPQGVSHRYDPTTPMDPRTQNDNSDPYAPARAGAQGGTPFFGGQNTKPDQGNGSSGSSPVTQFVNNLVNSASGGQPPAGMFRPEDQPNPPAVPNDYYAKAAQQASAAGSAAAQGAAAAKPPITGLNPAAAAQAAAAGNAAATGAATQPPGTATGPNAGASNVSANIPNSGSGINPEYASFVTSSDDNMLMEVLRSMGIDPSKQGLVGRTTAKAILPMIQAQSKLLGYANGGDGVTGADPASIVNAILGLGKSFTQAGADPWAHIRQLGSDYLSNPNALSQIGSLQDEGQQNQLLQFANQARMSGSNGLAQAATAALGDQAYTRYTMAAADAAKNGQPALNNFLAWLQTQPAEVRNRLLPTAR